MIHDRSMEIFTPKEFPHSGARKNSVSGITINSRNGTFYFTKLLADDKGLSPGNKIVVSRIKGQGWFWRIGNDEEGFELQDDRGYLKFVCRQLARMILHDVNGYLETATLKSSPEQEIQGQKWHKINL